ncbi:MAG: DUF1552 domain-containing protein [Planctomycetes bacterium]|nr:DUF1552 domain-containing protein [Planctomycetota bacterium]
MPNTRRDLLKGLTLGAGATLLSPILNDLRAQADGAKAQPKRFVFMLQSQGLQSWAVKPTEINRPGDHERLVGVEQLVTKPLKGLTLPEDIAGLQPFQDRMTIIQGLNGKHVSPYHGGPFGAMGGYLKGNTPSGQTIDAALATAHPSTFPLLGLGIGKYTNVEYCSSAWGANRAAPTMCHPDYAYKVLFGSVLQGKDRADFDSRTSLLDFMKEDVKRVQDRLAGPEKEKFDAQVAAYENMSKRQKDLRELAEQLKKVAPVKDKKYTDERETLQLEAHVELAAAALIGGLTRVVTIASGLCGHFGSFRGFTETPIEMHAHVGHGGATGRKLYTILRKFHIDQLALLAKKLQAVPEGDGTMLDNTVIVYTSDFGETHHSTGKDWAYVLLGNLGGKLKSGQYIDYPLFGKKGSRSINALYCTLLHAAGAPRDHFNLEGVLKNVDSPGPLAELMV